MSLSIFLLVPIILTSLPSNAHTSLDSFASINEDLFLDCLDGVQGMPEGDSFSGTPRSGPRPASCHAALEWEEEVAYLQHVRGPARPIGDSAHDKDEEDATWGCVLESIRRLDPIYLFEYSLRGFSSAKLRVILGWALRLYFLMSLSGIALSAYAISTTRWIR